MEIICEFCQQKVRYSATHQRTNHKKCVEKYETLQRQQELNDFKEWLQQAIARLIEK